MTQLSFRSRAPWLLHLCLVGLRVSQGRKAADCGAQAGSDVSVPKLQMPGSLPGLSCPGFAEDVSCCDPLPMQKVVAWLQYSAKHDEEHLGSLVNILSHVEETINAFASGAGDQECTPLVEKMLRPRVDAAKLLARRALEGLKIVEHLTISSLCAYCFPEEEGASFRISMQDGPAAEQLGALGAEMQRSQKNILLFDAELVNADPARRCVPEYLASLTQGTDVSDGVERDATADPKEQMFALQSSISLSVQAISRMRDWPLKRHESSHATDAHQGFDDDMIEVAERLQSMLRGPPARLAHQAQMLALAMERQYHWSSRHPLAVLMWGASAGPAAAESSKLESQAQDAVGNVEEMDMVTLRPYAVSDESTDIAGTAFGLVVLISNQTSQQTINELIVRLEGPRTLFLEDSCGGSLEALGHGCHGGGAQQSKCLRPVHTPYIVEYSQAREVRYRPRVAWRRHGSTRSIAHAAWEIGTSYWGKEAHIWLADVRPACACPGAVPLDHVLETEPQMQLHMVQKPEVLWSLYAANLECPDVDGEAISRNAPLQWMTSRHTPETPLSSRLAEYIAFHRKGVAAIANGAGDVRVLVYSCQPFAQCGGHGDRLNGIVSAFFLAVLTNRVFLIDYESPVPLQMVLTPHLIDWRVRGSIMATASLRHHSYHDKRQKFEADIGRLAEYPDNVLVVTKNYRMLRSMFEAPALRPQALELGLQVQAPNFLIAEVFEMLFMHSPVLKNELGEVRSQLGSLRERRFIAIHLRTGNIAWDPVRHGVEELKDFLSCAKHAEEELGLSEDTPWLLATDSADVAEAAQSLPSGRSGKLRIPSSQGRIHIDRSDLSDVLAGTVANYAEYLLFGQAAAVVLSRSYFGETAAEIGRVPNAYFAPGGGCVRTDLTSS